MTLVVSLLNQKGYQRVENFGRNIRLERGEDVILLSPYNGKCAIRKNGKVVSIISKVVEAVEVVKGL
jgi:hypothetical protein